VLQEAAVAAVDLEGVLAQKSAVELLVNLLPLLLVWRIVVVVAPVRLYSLAKRELVLETQAGKKKI
jgi:hypothetical protein